MTDEARWFVGIDWGSERHHACLLDATGKVIGERVFAHGGAGLAELCDWLLVSSGADPSQRQALLRRHASGLPDPVAHCYLPLGTGGRSA